jgi:rRNA maturation endonuclease Nob1
MFLYQIEESLKQKKKVAALLKEAEVEVNPVDRAVVDIPLMIRLFEYAREDAKSDIDLHRVTENIIRLSATGKLLTMSDYDEIIGGSTDV